VSLGYLYEEGLGVEADPVAALNWYRRAAGLAESLVVMEESEYAALLEARDELQRRAEEADSLRQEVEELRHQLQEFEERTEEDRVRRDRLESVTRRLEGELAAKDELVQRSRVQIASLEESLAAVAVSAPASGGHASVAAPRPTAPRSELAFGRYRALVIGNTDHAQLPRLATAAADARSVAELLETKYGFEVELLLNATRYQIMTALNGLREELTAKDNLLVYYAGHGVQEGEQAYWQPVDAEPGSPANWIPSEVVTEHLDLIPAQHLFLVADAAFSGLRTRSAIAQLPTGMTDEERFFHIRLLLDKRSRLVLTSGTAAPAADAGADEHSRFSSALIDVLEENDGILEASRVFRQVSDRLRTPAGPAPEFAPMRWARNNVADFFFVAESSP
jgi:Caspase domain/Sel1 repeat